MYALSQQSGHDIEAEFGKSLVYTRRALHASESIKDVRALGLSLAVDVDTLTQVILQGGLALPERFTVTRMEAQAYGQLPPDLLLIPKECSEYAPRYHKTEALRAAVLLLEFEFIPSPFDALDTHPEYEKKIAEQLFKAAAEKRR